MAGHEHEQLRQGSVRRYVDEGRFWSYVARDRTTVLWFRLLPFVVIGALMLVNYLDDELVRGRYVLVVAPVMIALVNGPIITLIAGMVSVAAYISGRSVSAYGLEADWWIDIPSVLIIALLAVFFAWARGRLIDRLLGITMVAETTQQAIVPEAPRHVGPYEIASVLRTPQGSTNLVGGDFFDVEASAHGMRLILGDVQGHDLQTIQITNTIMGAFKERAGDDISLSLLTERLHRRMVAINSGLSEWHQRFATALVAEFRPWDTSVTFLTCGHPPPVLIRDEARLLSLPALPPLGVEHQQNFESYVRQTPFHPGDMIHLYSDGMVEARNSAGDEFPMVKYMNEYLRRDYPRDPELFIDFIRQAFFRNNFVITDDLSSLTILYN
ncbi:PP2C family protein-serine/threonine phosphatase [Haloglycomyces albus]|uniref:PP2C family protein-serine/threonine phosphatase n=1 Tax=Haloglycomyces albus TaxID=526067 RepID=UPI00046CE1D2|nr:PP2C family protein-serine/threonine phosphatase [Haloglycomyces albus]